MLLVGYGGGDSDSNLHVCPQGPSQYWGDRCVHGSLVKDGGAAGILSQGRDILHSGAQHRDSQLTSRDLSELIPCLCDT